MEKAKVQDALSRKYPQGIVMVVTLDDKGKADVMPASWYMQTSINPTMFAVSIAPKRLTYDLIRKR